MLARLRAKIKRVVGFIERRDVYAMFLIIFVAAASFGIGRLSSVPRENTPVRIENVFESTEQAVVQNAAATTSDSGKVADTIEQIPVQGSFVGSRNSDKYHFPWCPGAQRIKEENKVWFATREDAEKAGYVPAKNCKGLE